MEVYSLTITKFCGGHLGRHFEFLKMLKGAKPAPGEILKSNVSPLRKYQNIYYTLPCHVRFKYIKYVPDYINWQGSVFPRGSWTGLPIRYGFKDLQ